MRELEEPRTASGCAYCGARTRYVLDEFCSQQCADDAWEMQLQDEQENYGAH